MKILALLTLAAAAVLPVQAATNISVSIGINAPGQYGRVDIDNYPRPVLSRPQPIIYQVTPVARQRRPIYLYVPQGHQDNWGRYCGRYSACNQPVYFVQETWVRDEYRREHDKGNRHSDAKQRKKDDKKNKKHRGRGHDKHGD